MFAYKCKITSMIMETKGKCPKNSSNYSSSSSFLLARFTQSQFSNLSHKLEIEKKKELWHRVAKIYLFTNKLSSINRFTSLTETMTVTWISLGCKQNIWGRPLGLWETLINTTQHFLPNILVYLLHVCSQKKSHNMAKWGYIPPIVLSWNSWNCPLTKRSTRLDFPTADSPKSTSLNWQILLPAFGPLGRVAPPLLAMSHCPVSPSGRWRAAMKCREYLSRREKTEQVKKL